MYAMFLLCCCTLIRICAVVHDDFIKWKHFPRYWPFARGIHRSPVNSPHKGQWRRALMFSLICVLINGWVNNHEASDLRPHPAIMTSSWTADGIGPRFHWQHSIFGDESIFQFYPVDGWLRVRRLPGERLWKDCQIAPVQAGGSSITV